MFVATNITPTDQIFKELTEIQLYLDARYQSDNPVACVDRGNDLEAYLARTSKLLADSKYHLDEFMNSAITDTIKDALSVGGWSASAINKKIDALCKDYNYLYLWAGRLNSASVHQLDFIRTLLSKHKEEIRQLNYR